MSEPYQDIVTHIKKWSKVDMCILMLLLLPIFWLNIWHSVNQEGDSALWSFLYIKALRYNFYFGNSLKKQLWNLTKVNESRSTKIIRSFTSFCKFFNQVFWVLTKLTIKNLINLLLTKLMVENLINLLFSKFKLSLSFDNSYQVNYVDYFCNWF